jgi:hypothetical protein
MSQVVASLACGHQAVTADPGTAILELLRCPDCDQLRRVLVYQPLDARGNVVHWPR